MQALKKTWFISDLHLDANHAEITSQFIRLMQSADASVDGIYILGDLFEAWIGDDDPSPFNQQMMATILNTTQRGTKVYFMQGNRDFLVGRKFMQKTGCRLLNDEEKINLYGTSVLLMHGDTLCTADTAYLRARKLAHNKWIQTIFLWLPICWRQKLAARARNASTQHTSTVEKYIMDVTQSEVERVMQHHGVNVLIHGHTHRPDTHPFTINHQDKTRIVLPAWHDGGSVFEWRENGERLLMALSTQTN